MKSITEIEVEVISKVRSGGKNTRYLVQSSDNSHLYSILVSNEKQIELGMKITVDESDLVGREEKNVHIIKEDKAVLPLNLLKSALVSISEKSKTNRIEPIYSLNELTEEQRMQLNNGSGHTNTEDEIAQINSSTALGINFYKAFEEITQRNDPSFHVEFEWRESTPLLKSQAPANIDVKYDFMNTVYFVECKYLEPYYMRVKPNSAAYCNPNRYPQKESAAIWTSLCNEINNAVTDIETPLTNFDAPQICRHLIAVYRHYKDNLERYKGKKIIVQSMSWLMPDSFITALSNLGVNSEEVKSIRSKIEKELEQFSRIINNHIQSLDWDCRFEFKHYNNELDMIRTSSKFDEICKQYSFPRTNK